MPDIGELDSGYLNPIEMLYSDKDMYEYPETIENVNNKNAYNISFYENSGFNAQGFPADTINAIIPGALQASMAVEAGGLLTM